MDPDIPLPPSSSYPVFTVGGTCIKVVRDFDWLFLSKFRVSKFTSNGGGGNDDDEDASGGEESKGIEEIDGITTPTTKKRKQKQKKKKKEPRKPSFEPTNIYLQGDTSRFITSPILSFVLRIKPVFNEKIIKHNPYIKISKEHALDDGMKNFEHHNLFEIDSVLVMTKSEAFNSVYTIREAIKNSEYFGPMLAEENSTMSRLKKIKTTDPEVGVKAVVENFGNVCYDQITEEDLANRRKQLKERIDALIIEPLKSAFNLGKPTDFLEVYHIEYLTGYNRIAHASTTDGRGANKRYQSPTTENNQSFYHQNVKYILNNMFKDQGYFQMVTELGGTLMLHISDYEARQILSDSIDKTKVLIRICTSMKIDDATSEIFVKNTTNSIRENDQRLAVKIITGMSRIYHDFLRAVRMYGHTFLYEKLWPEEVKTFLASNFSGDGANIENLSSIIAKKKKGKIVDVEEEEEDEEITRKNDGIVSVDLSKYIKESNNDLAQIRVYYNAQNGKYTVSALPISGMEKNLSQMLSTLHNITVCKAVLDDTYCLNNNNNSTAAANFDVYFCRIRDIISVYGRDKTLILCPQQRRAYLLHKMTLGNVMYIEEGSEKFSTLNQTTFPSSFVVETVIIDRSHVMGIPQFIRVLSRFKNTIKNLFLCGIPCCFPETLGHPLKNIAKARIQDRIFIEKWSSKSDLLTTNFGTAFNKIRSFVNDINQILQFPYNLNTPFEPNFVIVCSSDSEREQLIQSIRPQYARDVIRARKAVKLPHEILYSSDPPPLTIIKFNMYSERSFTKPQFMKVLNGSCSGEDTVVIVGNREELITMLKGKYLNRYSNLHRQLRNNILDDMYLQSGGEISTTTTKTPEVIIDDDESNYFDINEI